MLAREKIPLFAISAGSIAVTFVAQQSGGAMVASGVLDPGQRVANALVAYATYLGKAYIADGAGHLYPPSVSPILPRSLRRCSRSLPRSHWSRWCSYGACRICSSAGRSSSEPSCRSSASSESAHQAYADRYTYIPYIGLFIALVFCGRAALQRVDINPAIVARWCVARLIAVYALSAWQYVGHFKNSLRLWQHTLLSPTQATNG
ncbi:MAG: hypothetical protein U5O39_03590 [Gammaproteobacteria bacterium]|nr:hypothetical protein [Gammaproteobacteria bacterium]